MVSPQPLGKLSNKQRETKWPQLPAPGVPTNCPQVLQISCTGKVGLIGPTFKGDWTLSLMHNNFCSSSVSMTKPFPGARVGRPWPSQQAVTSLNTNGPSFQACFHAFRNPTGYCVDLPPWQRSRHSLWANHGISGSGMVECFALKTVASMPSLAMRSLFLGEKNVTRQSWERDGDGGDHQGWTILMKGSWGAEDLMQLKWSRDHNHSRWFPSPPRARGLVK